MTAGLFWMRFCIPDYLADTMHLTTLQTGAYNLLLMTYYMRGGPLPDDDAQLAAICKLSAHHWRKHRPILAGFFTVADGWWTQKRAQKELTHFSNIRSQRSKAGVLSAKARALKSHATDSTHVQHKLNGKANKRPTIQSQSQSQSHRQESQVETHGSRNGSRIKNQNRNLSTGRRARDPKTEDSKSDSRDPVDATRPTATIIEHQVAWFTAASAELRRRLPPDIAQPIISAALAAGSNAKDTLEKYWRSRSRRGRV